MQLTNRAKLSWQLSYQTQKDILKIFDNQYRRIAFKVREHYSRLGCLINCVENIPALVLVYWRRKWVWLFFTGTKWWRVRHRTLFEGKSRISSLVLLIWISFPSQADRMKKTGISWRSHHAIPGQARPELCKAGSIESWIPHEFYDK